MAPGLGICITFCFSKVGYILNKQSSYDEQKWVDIPKSIPGLMVNIWLLEFRVPPLLVKNKIINTGKKEKEKKENFI